MTSAQTMQPAYVALVGARWIAIATLILALFGCGEQLRPAPALRAPYDAPHLWGVVPPVNESGVSAVDTARIADAIMQEAQRVSNVNAVPVNRVISGMRAVGVDRISSDGEAQALMNLLDLDGLIVGTVTAYDPYRPMKFGLAIQLYSREPRDERSGLDPQKLAESIRGDAAIGSLGPPHATAQAAGVFDARDHETLTWLRTYARGRSEPGSAYGHDIYLVRMDLFAQFVSHRLIRDLLAQEWARSHPMTKVSP